MPDASTNFVAVVLFLTAAALVPLFVVTMTGFLKISVVMFLIRNALGPGHCCDARD